MELKDHERRDAISARCFPAELAGPRRGREAGRDGRWIVQVAGFAEDPDGGRVLFTYKICHTDLFGVFLNLCAPFVWTSRTILPGLQDHPNFLLILQPLSRYCPSAPTNIPLTVDFCLLLYCKPITHQNL